VSVQQARLAFRAADRRWLVSARRSRSGGRTP